MDYERLTQLNSFLANLVVWAGVFIALAFGAWRWGGTVCSTCRGWCRGILLAHRFALRWGDSGAEVLQEEIVGLRWRIHELRIRLSAAEGMLGIGAFTGDAELSIEWLSPHAVTLFGFDSSELLGRNWIARVDDQSRDAVESLWRLACGKRITSQGTIVTISGKRLSLLLCPSVDSNGNVVSIYGQVTEAKR